MGETLIYLKCFLESMIKTSKWFNGWVSVFSVLTAFSSLTPGASGDEPLPKPGLGNRVSETLGEVLNVGPFELRPHLDGSVLYDDNIFLTEFDRQEDVVWTVAPGLLIGAGDYRATSETYLALDYTPSVVVFTDHDENNALNHDVNFFAQWKLTKLSLGLGQSYQRRSGGLVQADTSVGFDREISSQQVDREIFVTTLKAKYDWSDKTSFEVNGSQTINQSDKFIAYNEWVNQNWVNYNVTEKVRVGVGFTLGFRDIKQSDNEIFEQGLVRASYTLTEKVDVTGSIGAEFRQFQGGESEGPDLVFTLGGFYRPLDRTLLGLEAYRQNQNSVVMVSENYTVTGVRASVRQQLLERFSISLTGGYQHLAYDSTGSGGAGSGREDDYFFVGPGFDYNITDRWTAGVFYQYRQTSSSEPNAGFENNQAGLRSTFRF